MDKQPKKNNSPENLDPLVAEGLKFFRENGTLMVGSYQNKFNLNLADAEKLIEKIERILDGDTLEAEGPDPLVAEGLKFFHENGTLMVGAYQNKFKLSLADAEKLIEKVEAAYDKELEEKALDGSPDKNTKKNEPGQVIISNDNIIENKNDNKNDIDTEEKIKEKAEIEFIEKILEKVRQRGAVVNIEEIAEAEARKGADAYMTEPDGKANWFKRFWKHTVAEGFYRGREVTRVSKEIQKTGNIYTRRVGDNPDKTAHKTATKAISDRFRSDYEDSLVLSKGEERKFLDNNDKEVVKSKNDLKNLLDDYAMGNIDDEVFENNKKGIIDNLKKDETLFKGANNYADNLFEIAQNAKIAYNHGIKLEELDYDLDIIVGKAKSSLKTEAHLNLIDKGIDKMKKSKVGRYISPTVLSTGVGVAYSLITGVNALASTKVGQAIGGIGSLGISVGVSTAFAAANESERIAKEKKQSFLDEVEGGEGSPNDKSREQMSKFKYELEKSINLSQRLRDLMFEKDKEGNDVVKDIKPEDLKDIIACLGNIDARKSLNASNKIDLISYSNIGNVEKESTDLTILTAQAKFELEKRVKTDLKSGLPQGINSYEEYLSSVTNAMRDSLLGGEKGINAQDRAFSRYKTWRVAKKAAVTATVGIFVGGLIRELMAVGSDHVQSLFNNPGGATTETPARHLWDIISGNQTHMGMDHSAILDIGNHNFQVPEGVTILQNGNAIDIMRGDHVISHLIPQYNADGTLDASTLAKLGNDGILSTGIHNVINSTQEVTSNAQEWIHNHPGETASVHHVSDGPYMDNNTPSVPDSANPGHMIGADGNELGMRWGGLNGTGVNGNGDAVLNISHMDSIHSVHGNISVDVPKEALNGNLMAVVYLDGVVHGQGILVPVGADGNIVFDHNNPIMQQIFKLDAKGHMVSHAKVIELVQKMGVDKNGVHQIRAISAIVGEGLGKIKDYIPCYNDISINTIIPSVDVQNPLFVPLVARRPLGPVTFGEKDKKQKEKDHAEIVSATKKEEIAKKKKEVIEKYKTADKIPVEDKKAEEKKITPENKSILNENEQIFKAEDLTKAGTVFVDNEGIKHTITGKLLNNSWIDRIMGKTLIQGIVVDKNGKDIITSYNIKELKNKFNEGIIKIAKVEVKK